MSYVGICPTHGAVAVWAEEVGPPALAICGVAVKDDDPLVIVRCGRLLATPFYPDFPPEPKRANPLEVLDGDETYEQWNQRLFGAGSATRGNEPHA